MNIRVRYFFFLVFVVFLFFGCIEREKVSSLAMLTVDVSAEFDSVIEIKRWLAIGPFEFDTITICPTESFFNEDLNQFGIEEGWIDMAGVKKLQEQGARVFMIDQKTVKIRMSMGQLSIHKVLHYLCSTNYKCNIMYIIALKYDARNPTAMKTLDFVLSLGY